MELSEPYQIAYETVSHCDNITLKLITDSGLVGYGLAAPDKEITNESAEDVVNSITDFITPLLKGEHPFRISYWMRALKENPKIGSSAKAMVDIALHDLLARKARLPLYQLLGGFRESIPTSVTIGIKPLDETLEIARKYFGSGFNIIKLKGGLNLDEDIEKIVVITSYSIHYTKLYDDGDRPPEEGFEVRLRLHLDFVHFDPAGPPRP